MQCDLCGRNTDNLLDAIIEGTSVQVCLNCSKYGKVITLNPDAIVEKHIEREQEFSNQNLIVEDYNIRIKKAREKKGLKQEDVARAIAEKESVIHQLETGTLKPSLKLAKKLSVFLDITLTNKENYKNISVRDMLD